MMRDHIMIIIDMSSIITTSNESGISSGKTIDSSSQQPCKYNLIIVNNHMNNTKQHNNNKQHTNITNDANANTISKSEIKGMAQRHNKRLQNKAYPCYTKPTIHG